ncbi:MAG: hypothetical protein AAF600_21625 [Bacteroidota bacterium]
MKKIRFNRFSKAKGLFSILFCLLFIAFSSCSSEDSDKTEPQGPLYSVFWSVNLPDGRANYISFVDDLITGTIDQSSSIELFGYTRYFPNSGQNYFITADNEDFSLTRYNVDDEGKVTIENTLSLKNEGVTWIYNNHVFVNDLTAYYIDTSQGRIIIYDPEEMIVTGYIELPEQMRTGYQGFETGYSIDPKVVDGKIYITVSWINWDTGDYLHKTGLTVVDVNSNSILSYSEDDRVPIATSNIYAENGDIYFGISADAHFTSTRSLEDFGGILKVKAGSNEFDQSFDPYFMNQIEGKRIGLGLGQSPIQGRAYIRILDTSLAEWSPEGDGSEYYGFVFDTYEIDLETNTVLGKVDLPKAPSYFWPQIISIDGEMYSALEGEEYGTLIRYSSDGSYVEGLKTPSGSINSFSRFR